MTPPHVTEPIVTIPPHLIKWVEEIVQAAKNERYGLEGGPKEYFPIDRRMAHEHRLISTADLYTTRGRVAAHTDGAGETYGLVIIAENGHDLFIGPRRPTSTDDMFELLPGSVYHIDSNEDHGTSCRGNSKSDILAIITMDFYGRKPTISYEDFAHEALAAMERGYAKQSENDMQSLTDSAEENQ